MDTQIKKVNGVLRNSIRKLDGFQLSEELFCNSLLSDANLVSYWRMEGNSNDYKNTNNGTDTNTSYSTSYGKFGQGLSLSGNGKITVKAGAILVGGTAYSINLWVKTTDAVNTMCLYAETNTTNGTPVMEFGVASGHPYFFTRNTANTQIQEITTLYNIADGNWHMVTLIKSSETDYAIYADGNTTPIGTGSTSVTVYSINNSNIGALVRTSTLQYFTGYLDEISLFNKGLSSTEMVSLYNSKIKKFMGVSNI